MAAPMTIQMQRTHPMEPWGFRMGGGKDFCQQLNIKKVTPNTPATRCNLAAGDMIVRIGNYDASQLTHAQATQVIKSSGNALQLVVQKGQFNFNRPRGPIKFSPGTAASLSQQQHRW